MSPSRCMKKSVQNERWSFLPYRPHFWWNCTGMHAINSESTLIQVMAIPCTETVRFRGREISCAGPVSYLYTAPGVCHLIAMTAGCYKLSVSVSMCFDQIKIILKPLWFRIMNSLVFIPRTAFGRWWTSGIPLTDRWIFTFHRKQLDVIAYPYK